MTRTETAAMTAAPAAPEAVPFQRRNFAVMVAHMVFQRVGWIFKLESVVIPAFVGALTTSSYALAALPVLHRVGERLPTLIGGRLAYGRTHLGRLLALWMGGFALVWGGVALALWVIPADRDGGFLIPFLLAYMLAFIFFGTAQVFRGALTGRVIRVTRRGAYVGLSSMLGGLTAIGSGLVIRQLLLDGDALRPRQFAPIFTCAFAFFAVAAALALLVREPPSPARAVLPDPRTFWRRAAEILRHDRNFRRLLIAVMLLQIHTYVFPFYIRMGLDRAVITRATLGILVMVQNVSLAVSTPLMGILADRGGHRRVLLICFTVTMFVPVYAAAACQLPKPGATYAYVVLFALIGFGPSLQRFLANYVLEISTTADHAVYLSTFETLQLATVVYAPFVGFIADRLSIAGAMLAAATVMGAGLFAALRLVEPRHRAVAAAEPLPPGPGAVE